MKTLNIILFLFILLITSEIINAIEEVKEAKDLQKSSRLKKKLKEKKQKKSHKKSRKNPKETQPRFSEETKKAIQKKVRETFKKDLFHRNQREL
ncbi:phistb domain-containing resa-like protein [Anaeramoeba ignava]|uniref:Phistb domain-containing resa-like protein n=1 Tax=Anaeramoeba ignava TaxID=1746090 RepID=A0A9Q0RHT3_ANAIG|nr:phistb domain-containing resa-like protein [Anaeramoeba ignava]